MLRIACFIAAICLTPSWGGYAQQSPTSKLENKLSVAWKNKELNAALQRLTNTQQLAIWLDRRIDPQQKINLEFKQATLHQLLEEIADQCNLGICPLGNLLYLGPKHAADELPLLAKHSRETLEQAHPVIKRRWLNPRTVEWSDLSEPRQLLAEIAEGLNVEVIGLKHVPHDLWRRPDLPLMSPVDQVVLFLIGFDLTCEIASDGKSFRIISYERPLQRKTTTKSRALKPQKRSAKTAKQVYSLKIKNQPVGAVIDQLARQLNLTVQWDAELAAANPTIRKTMISCDLENLNQKQLLEGLLKPAKLTGKLSGSQLMILPLETKSQ